MALQPWPSRVEVEFTEVSEQITAIIYDRFSGRVLAALQDRQPDAIMRQVHHASELHRAEAVFRRPWPHRMEEFFRSEVAKMAETRRKLADSGLNVKDDKKPAKGRE